ncbi:helix-turn-helix transcriptional regulator [Microbacterium sp.]|uniref:helix-turn-helix transcriptional regulator n=1 Tax=Microbacterium sp. TaxID=51671 RepID=UPI0039E41367
MSVRQSLLAILDQGPCYGYQLRAEFARRTGGTWPLNVGQIYNTLDRLERDGLVARGEADAQGHVYWRITDAGSHEVADWLSAPVARPDGSRDDLAIKLTMAATLPGVDVAAVVRTQRAASAGRLAALRADDSTHDAGPEQVVRELLHEAAVFAAEAELRWLDGVAARLASSGTAAVLELSADRPKRGRPAARSATPGD